MVSRLVSALGRLAINHRLDIVAVWVFATASALGPGNRAAAQGNESVLRGVVVSAADSGTIFAAELRAVSGRAITRTDQAGKFSVRLVPGDSVVVHALGFREQRVAMTQGIRVLLRPLPTVLPTLTTTVGQREIRASESTSHTTVLDRADIDAAGAISANQLLRQIPGLQELPSPPSQTSIAIRGFDASRVLVLIDGEPTSGALVENRDIGRLSTVAAERIEVTKGPSSVEFGSDALGGVINLVTAAPTKTFSADGLFRQGELGRRESTVGASQTIGNFGYRVSGGWRQVDRVAGVDAEGSSLERVFDLRTNARYKLSDRASLRVDVQGSRERQRWPIGGGYNGFIDNRTGQGFVEGQLQALGGAFRVRVFAQRYSYQYRQSQKDVPIAGTGDSLEQRERLARYLVAYSRSAGRQTIDVGGQFSTRNLISPRKVDGDSAADHVDEVFARDSWTVGSVLASAGVRYSNSSLWGAAVNPSFGAAWQIEPSLRLRSNVARGFRAPSFKEIRYTFSNPSVGYTVIGNSNLDPESSWSTSIGGTWAPVSHLSVDVEGYRNTVSNLIDTRYQGLNAAGFQVYQNVNVAKAHTAGVETNLQFVNGPLEIGMGYNYLRARNDETAMPLGRRASHSARVRVARTWSFFSGVTADATASYTGSAPLVGTVGDAPAIVGTQGEFLSIDAQLRARLTRLAELSVGVNNLLDKRPVLYSPAYQRQLFVALHIKLARAE
ncbi:MAG: TonB-dependent receptor [Gemmatimonas sp.]